MSKVSIVITVRNEARHIRHLLDSLVPQQSVREVILVDAMSTDGTADIAQEYQARLPLRIVRQA